MINIATIACLLFAFAQDKGPQFQPGQSVYVVAIKVDTSRSDLTVESNVRREFQRREKFPLAKSPASADFVFLVFTEYDTEISHTSDHRDRTVVSQDFLKHALALVVSAKDYNEHKGDIDKLKEFSVWEKEERRTISLTPILLTPQGVSAAKLVKQFHDFVFKKK
jgi:hypothetical protein